MAGSWVFVNAGDLIKSLRAEKMATWPQSSKAAMAVADRFSTVTTLVPPLLNTVDFAHRILGPWPLKTVAGLLNKATGQYVPDWNPYMPAGAGKLRAPPKPEAGAAPAEGHRGIPRQVRTHDASVTCGARMVADASMRLLACGLVPVPDAGVSLRFAQSADLAWDMATSALTIAHAWKRLQVVYLPSCVTRMMGPARSDSEREPVHAKLMSIFAKVRAPWFQG